MTLSLSKLNNVIGRIFGYLADIPEAFWLNSRLVYRGFFAVGSMFQQHYYKSGPVVFDDDDGTVLVECAIGAALLLFITGALVVLGSILYQGIIASEAVRHSARKMALDLANDTSGTWDIPQSAICTDVIEFPPEEGAAKWPAFQTCRYLQNMGAKFEIYPWDVTTSTREESHFDRKYQIVEVVAELDLVSSWQSTGLAQWVIDAFGGALKTSVRAQFIRQ